MSHPQNSPRGLFTKKDFRVGTSGHVYFDSYATTALLTANSTGLLVAGSVRVSGKRYISANSTGFLPQTTATIPSARSLTGRFAFIKTAAGTGAIAVNTTGATWKYLRVTSTINHT